MNTKPKTTEGKGIKIEVVIREMINKVLEVGRKPREIKLTESDHNELVKELGSFYPAGYEVTPTGVMYWREPQIKKISTYQGLPVVIDDYTMVVWL